jgi:putrescine transport system permease protein
VPPCLLDRHETRFVSDRVPYLWLLALFLVPFLIVLKISAVGHGACHPALHAHARPRGLGRYPLFFAALDFENFAFLASDDLYWKAYLSSLQIALISTLLTLLVGYPIAYGMAARPEEWRPTLMMLVILPFWTSFLIRVYAWMGILDQEGLSEPVPALDRPDPSR